MENTMTIPDAITYLESNQPPVTSAGAEAIDQLVLSMMADGWECRGPDEKVEVTDRLMIEGGQYEGGMVWRAKRCVRCNGKLMYLPFVKGREYKPFTVCTGCGRTREF